MWDVMSGQPLRVLGEKLGNLSSLAFGGDGSVLSFRSGGNVHKWNVATGKEISSEPLPVWTRAMSPTEDRVACATKNRPAVELYQLREKLGTGLHNFTHPKYDSIFLDIPATHWKYSRRGVG